VELVSKSFIFCIPRCPANDFWDPHFDNPYIVLYLTDLCRLASYCDISRRPCSPGSSGCSSGGWASGWPAWPRDPAATRGPSDDIVSRSAGSPRAGGSRPAAAWTGCPVWSCVRTWPHPESGDTNRMSELNWMRHYAVHVVPLPLRPTTPSTHFNWN